MKILIVTQYFWPENFRINDLVAGLIERGHVCTVLTGIPNYPDGKVYKGYGGFKGLRSETHNGARIIRVPLIPRGSGSGLRLALNYASFVLSASMLGPILCRDRYDVIFVHEPSPITVMLPALLLKKLRGAPVVLWLQDLWPESVSATGAVRSGLVLRLIERMVRFIYRRCDRILPTSKAYQPSIVERGGEPSRIVYFPQSVEEIFRPLEGEDHASQEINIPSGFCVMFAGNIGAAQDFPTILGAAERLRGYPDIHLVVLGSGRMMSWVEENVKKRRLESTVHMLGRYPSDAMPRFYAQADAMLLSLRKQPIFALTVPAKLQSYLACARPVIAAVEGEAARIVCEAGAGVACPAEDPVALSDAILAMYRLSKDERHAMGCRGRRYFQQHFDSARLMDRLEGLFAELALGRA